MSDFYKDRMAGRMNFTAQKIIDMKRLILLLSMALYVTGNHAQTMLTLQKTNNMKMNAGIVTRNLAETKAFYTRVLNFGVTFENEFYLLMHTPGHEAQLSFLLPDHPSQQPLFHQPFQGAGMYLTIEVEDVDRLYKEVKRKGVEIAIALRDEPWGDRHFAIRDPNGIGIDIVKYVPPQEEP